MDNIFPYEEYDEALSCGIDVLFEHNEKICKSLFQFLLIYLK